MFMRLPPRGYDLEPCANTRGLIQNIEELIVLFAVESTARNRARPIIELATTTA